MWRTSDGERVLQGAEWLLFQHGLSCLWDWVEQSFDEADAADVGVRSFDDLQPGQKLAMLALVGQAMYDATMPPPELTAHTEGTAAAVFQHIRDMIEYEVECQDEPEMTEHATFWRDLVLAAAREVEVGWEEPLPDSRCDDFGEWICLLECLSSRIFWDADYDMGRYFLDADPEECRAKLQEMGIHPDYFLSVALDPRDEELDHLRATLRQLTLRPEPEEEKSYLGFEDSYHGLFVGPCDEAMLTAETDCPWIGEIEMGGGFDCTYEQWVMLFREETRFAATLVPDPVVLTTEQQAQAKAGNETGEPIIVDGGHRIERRDDGWVVIDNQGDFLVEVERCCWSEDEDDPDLPALKWPTPEEALVGWLEAEAIDAARSARYEVAMKRLGESVAG